MGNERHWQIADAGGHTLLAPSYTLPLFPSFSFPVLPLPSFTSSYSFPASSPLPLPFPPVSFPPFSYPSPFSPAKGPGSFVNSSAGLGPPVHL